MKHKQLIESNVLSDDSFYLFARSIFEDEFVEEFVPLPFSVLEYNIVFVFSLGEGARLGCGEFPIGWRH